MIEIGQLRCFVAVAEELHFGRAARRLHMTQPPLSRQIQVLERVVGAKLLERSSRQVSLTAAGAVFLLEAQRIVRLAEAATLAARRVAGGQSGRVAVGFTAVSGYTLVPALVARAREALPEIALELYEMVTADQVEGLTSGQLDVALLRPPVDRARFESRALVAEGLAVAVGPGHRLAAQERLRLGDLDDESLVMYSRWGAGYFHALVSRLLEAERAVPRQVQHVTQIHSMLGLVHAGLGAAVVPESAAELSFGDVVFRPLDTEPARPVELHFAWRRDNANPGLPAVLDLLDQKGKESVGGSR
jgi:DNA-binding transcriptional LysR family regulator